MHTAKRLRGYVATLALLLTGASAPEPASPLRVCVGVTNRYHLENPTTYTWTLPCVRMCVEGRADAVRVNGMDIPCPLILELIELEV